MKMGSRITTSSVNMSIGEMADQNASFPESYQHSFLGMRTRLTLLIHFSERYAHGSDAPHWKARVKKEGMIHTMTTSIEILVIF